MQGVIGVVTCFAGDFAPRNWAFCNGQLLAIAQNQALFSILGTTYGGNGTTNFALPNLQSRTAVSSGAGPGLGNYTLGQMSGAESVTLSVTNLPAHVHNGPVSLQMDADSSEGSMSRAVNTYPAAYAGAYSATPGASMATPPYTVTIGNAGNSQPIPIRAPYLGINYIICLTGIFPSRN